MALKKKLKIVKSTPPAPLKESVTKRTPMTPIPPDAPFERVKVTFAIPNHIYLMGKQRARMTGMSLNAYVGNLIYQDGTKTNEHIINVNVPALPSNAVPPPSLPSQKNPLDTYPDVFVYHDPEAPKGEPTKMQIPWKMIYDYVQFVDKNWPHRRNMPQPGEVAEKMGLAYEFGQACEFAAFDSNNFQLYLEARKRAIRRGFHPDDDIPEDYVSMIPKEDEGDDDE